MKITLPTSTIGTWDDFHDVSAEVFGFPDFYGRNMNAWIDCLSCLGEDDGMTSIDLRAGDFLWIELDEPEVAFQERCPEIYSEFITCLSLINQRREESGDPPNVGLVR